MTNKIIAVQGNNLNNLNPLTDTSIFLAKSGENRGYKIFYYEPVSYTHLRAHET